MTLRELIAQTINTMEISMNEQRVESQSSSRCWVGLDWGEFSHAVSVVDDARRVVARFEVDATLEGLEVLGQRLGEVGVVVGIAIESTSNLVVAFLLSKGFEVYLINPKISKHWREGNCVAGVKSDARDGLVLAVELARRHESLRAVRRSPSVVAELASLCETVRNLVDQRTGLLQQLKAVLRQYYPAALEFFKDLGSPVSWRFLKRFPHPEELARARKATLCRFLKSNRVGLSPCWLERIEQARHAARWPRPQQDLALELTMLSVVARLQALQPHIDKCDRLIVENCKDLPEAALMRSLPGTGDRLAPALTAIALLVADEENSLQAMRCLSGVAPVEDSSGKRRNTRIRARCNKHWRNVLHLYTRMSVQHCTWARAFYELCRERGDGFATALRKLADKWLKIIHRMLASNTPYNDQRYLEALRKAGSPVYAKLCGEAGG
jgi:transposase